MSRGRLLTLAMLALAWCTWWLTGRLLEQIGLADFALPLSTAILVAALSAAEAALKRLLPSDDHS